MNLTIRYSLLAILISLSPLTMANDKITDAIAVQSESTDESSLVTVVTKGLTLAGIAQPEAHSTFIQIVLPNTQSSLKGEFFDGDSPFIRKVALFSVGETDLGLRLFTSQDPKTIIGSLSVQPLKGRLLIHLDHKTIPPPLTGIPSVEEVVANTIVKNDIADPALQSSENVAKLAADEKSVTPEVPASAVVAAKESVAVEPEPAPTEPVIDSTSLPSIPANISHELLENKMIYVTVFVIFFIVFIGGSLLAKKTLTTGFKPKKSAKLGSDLYPIAHYQVGPKQKISLLEIDNHKILIGVSAEQISYLTTIDGDSNSGSGPAVKAQAPSSRQLSPQRTLEQTPYSRQVRQDSSIAQKPPQPKPAPPQSPTRPAPRSDDQKSIEDVTNLIRKKLKNLPNV